MNKTLKKLQKDCWQFINQECQEMAHRGDFGGMHEVVMKLGDRSSKPCTRVTITAE